MLRLPAKKSLLQLASLLVVMVIAFCVALVCYPPPSSPQNNPTSLAVGASPTRKKAMPKPLARLKIPKIHVNAVIKPVGLTADGAMEVPKNQTDVAWFKLSARPQQKGSTVIAGHYGWEKGRPSVFNNLHTLRAGDKLYVKDKNGTVTAFAVREIRRYDPKAEAKEVFSSSDGKSHLNLVTCDGDWNAALQTYSRRLVVFSDRVL